MGLALKNDAPMVSITKLKREPNEIAQQSKKASSGVYILSNNQPVIVALEPAVYAHLVDIQNKYEEMKKQHIQLLEEEMLVELKKTNGKTFSSVEDLFEDLERDED